MTANGNHAVASARGIDCRPLPLDRRLGRRHVTTGKNLGAIIIGDFNDFLYERDKVVDELVRRVSRYCR